MIACAYCGAPLPPGATFCAACGHAPGAPADPSRGGVRALRPTRPNPRAAIVLAAMPATALVGVFGYGAATGSGGPGMEGLAPIAIACALAWGLAGAVWRGVAWARWLALALTFAWGAFMLFATLQQISQLDSPHLARYPEMRRSVVFATVLSALELLLAGAALVLLVVQGSRATTARP